MDSEELKKIDRQKLQEIINFKNFEYSVNENADSWLDSIDKKPIKRVENDKPELPL